MTATNRDHQGDDAHFDAPATCEEVQCCGHDHPETDVSGEAESHCGEGCCAHDEDLDCESNVDQCEDACCGDHEGHSIQEEPAEGTEPRGVRHIPSRTSG